MKYRNYRTRGALMTLQEIKTKYDEKPYFEKLKLRLRNNREVANFYEWHADELKEAFYPRMGLDFEIVPKQTYVKTAENLRSCCQYWDIDYYPLQAVKDMKRTNLCHNRFCDNCQNVLSMQRFRKYGPYLDILAEKFDIYHIVFTQPNCRRDELGACVDKIFKNFKYIIRLFNGNANIRGFDFTKYGFFGAIRALEVTKNLETGKFHPHLHTLFVLEKGLKLDCNRTHINCYSFSRDEHIKRSHHKKSPGEPERYFGDFEILLQKIWRLRLDGVRVTAKSIEDLPVGYSVICDNARGKYKEVFKYALKGVFSKLKKDKALSEMTEDEAMQDLDIRYNDFKALLHALQNRRICQGYAKLNCLNFDESIDQSAKNDEAYWEKIAALCELETPERIYEFFDDMCREAERKNVTYISRRSISEVLAKEDEDVWELK